jgi:RimJ/RimL family protein N-acetyltransferase
MPNPWWPLFDLRLAVDDLLLRPMTEADLAPLAAALPDDLELNPAATTYPGLPQRINRGIITHQSYWSAWGSWSPASWRLPFVVLHGNQLIGTQSLEGDDFARLRVVDSSSYLQPEWRGRGHGKAMRRAILALAFGPLGAEMAVTSAWHDNHASLGVSRALGYALNGETRHASGDRVDRLVHLRLERATWLASGLAAGVTIDGITPCLPLFGLD